MELRAIAFDFDGTLVRTGLTGLDKGIHIMYATYVACQECGFRRYLHPEAPEQDVARMLRAYLCYPGAPRFQQLAALVNCLVNDCPQAVADAAGLKVEATLQAEYEGVRRRYNGLYSALNDTAAARYWAPFPSVKSTLTALARDFDLYVASGVTQDILEADLKHHGFDVALFQQIRGGNTTGGSDKGEILADIRGKGYADVLFVADATLDQQYAKRAGTRFYRIRCDEDYPRLMELLRQGFPDQQEPWDYSPDDRRIFSAKALHLVRRHLAHEPLSLEAATAWINS